MDQPAGGAEDEAGARPYAEFCFAADPITGTLMGDDGRWGRLGSIEPEVGFRDRFPAFGSQLPASAAPLLGAP